MNQDLHIISATIEDFMGIEFLKIDRAGKVNLVTGDQGTGKTSLMKALQEAFKSSGKDPGTIRMGKDKAKIMVELSGGVSCTRTITSSGNTAKVTINGEPVTKPQAVLSDLFKLDYIFRPVDFVRADKRARRSMLLQAVPVQITPDWLTEQLGELAEAINCDRFDFSKHGLDLVGEIREHVYERRAEINRTRDRLTKAIDQDKKDLPDSLDTERFKDFSPAAKRDELSRAEGAIASHKANLDRLEKLREERDGLTEEITRVESALDEELHRIDAEIAKLQARKEDLSLRADQRKKQIAKRKAEIVSEGQALRAAVDAFEPPDVESMRAELVDWDVVQECKASLKLLERRRQELAEADAEWEQLDQAHKLLVDAVPRAMLAAAKMPVPNLELKGDDIIIGGIPLEKRSETEQWDFTMEIARALAGPLKILIIDGYESLGSKFRAKLAEAQERDNFQYWITEVKVGQAERHIETHGKVA